VPYPTATVPSPAEDLPPAAGEAPDPCVRHLFAGPGFLIGEFRCPPGAARWRAENWIGRQAHVVVPGTPVTIVPAGADPHLSTANEVLVYDPDVYYRRRLASRDGDRCRFLALDDALAAELALTGGPRRRRPRLRHCPLPPRAYAGHRLLYALAARPDADRLAVEELALALLGGAARRLAVEGSSTGVTGAAERSRRDAVEAVKRLVAARLAEPLSLAGLAGEVHYSPYFLARMFRRHTGYPIGVFRQQLRLRASLDRVLDRSAGLTEVATEYGFSSHSHYTRVFREAFGCPPSELRRAAGAADVRRLRHAAQVLNAEPAQVLST
jgi:AraC-like DNA-binding protein